MKTIRDRSKSINGAQVLLTTVWTTPSTTYSPMRTTESCATERVTYWWISDWPLARPLSPSLCLHWFGIIWDHFRYDVCCTDRLCRLLFHINYYFGTKYHLRSERNLKAIQTDPIGVDNEKVHSIWLNIWFVFLFIFELTVFLLKYVLYPRV